VRKTTKKRLPPDIVSHWPEVLEDVDVSAVPIEYLHSIRIIFKDNKIWDIDLRKEGGTKSLENALKELFEQYDERIKHVDFRLDTSRVKADIQRRTRRFMKNLKKDKPKKT
jgi:hypothetical protein